MAVVAATWILPGPWPDALVGVLQAAGLALAVLGLGLATWASRALGSALTPFPQPRAGAELARRGPYRLARHPIYGAGLLFFGGVSFARSTIPGLVLTAALGVLWWRKSLAEERRLESVYPDYPAYRERTPRRFLPYLL